MHAVTVHHACDGHHPDRLLNKHGPKAKVEKGVHGTIHTSDEWVNAARR